MTHQVQHQFSRKKVTELKIRHTSYILLSKSLASEGVESAKIVEVVVLIGAISILVSVLACELVAQNARDNT